MSRRDRAMVLVAALSLALGAGAGAGEVDEIFGVIPLRRISPEQARQYAAAAPYRALRPVYAGPDARVQYLAGYAGYDYALGRRARRPPNALGTGYAAPRHRGFFGRHRAW